MKPKWIAQYWDETKDCQVKRGFDTYEEAMTFKHKMERKLNRRVWVGLR